MAWLHRPFADPRKVLAAAALGLALAATAASTVLAATPIYVRTDGDDMACNGTVNADASAAPNCAVETIQKGIDIVDAGGTVNVGAGTYVEDVNANKAVTLLGAGSGTTTISGPSGGGGSTVAVNALSVVIDGFTITREGNTVGTWNDAGLNSAGISIQSAGKSMEVRNCVLTGNRTGIDINDNSGANIHNNVIDFNRTGLIMRNVTDNLVIQENEITDNWTVGILFLDASVGSNVPLQTALNATIQNNDISGNWYGGIVDRQTGGSLPLPGTTNLKNFSGNWLGTITPVVTTANSAEPGYAAQIPVAYGGSATNPGGAPDVAGTASANVDFTPWLAVGTDTSGTMGFQGDFSTLWVDDNGAQTGATGRVQEGVNSALAAGTVRIAAGTYEEQVEITAARTLQGVGTTSIIKAPTALTLFFLTGANANRPVLYAHGTNDVVIKDLKVDGAGRGNANYRFVGVGFNNAGGTVQNTHIVDVRNAPLDGTQHGNAFYTYNDDATTRTINVTGNTISGFQKNGITVNTSASTAVVVSIANNTVTGAGNTPSTAQNGIQVWSDLGSGTIEDNTISGIAYSGSGTVASSILNYYTELTIDDNVITGAQTGIYNYDGGANLTDNDITVVEVGDYSWGIIASDPPHAVPQPVDGAYLGGGGGGAIAAAGAAGDGLQSALSALAPQALLTVAVTGNTIAFVGADNTSTYGIEADAGYGPDDMAVNIDNNIINGFDVGVVWWKCESTCGAGVFTAMSASGNCFTDNDEGMTSNVTSPTVNAENNWWGDASGPYNATSNPSGTGDSASANIDFTPWTSAGCSQPDTYRNERTGEYGTLAALLASAQYGDTIVVVGGEPLTGGIVITTPGITLDLEGRTGGPGSPFLTVAAADVTLTNAVLDGGGSGDPAVLVTTGGDNFTLSDSEVKNWADGVEVAVSVTSFKMFGNWIHSNTGAGLQVNSGVAFGGVVTIEGNLFKVNGGNGIQNDGTTSPLAAERNSWGDVAGPTGPSGDGASAGVDYTPHTFAELHLDMDPVAVGDQTSVNISEGAAFVADLKVDAQKLNSIQFEVTYDTAYLTLSSTTFIAPWLGQCTNNGSGPGIVKYFCTLFISEWDGGTLAKLNFTAANPPPGPGPWPTNLDIAHLEADSAASALGGAKIFLNNAGYNAPSVASRDITDTNDGTVNIIGKANYNGFIDLQGRTNDSGGKLRVFDIATKSGSVEYAQGTSAASGSYATAHNVGYELLVGTTYHLLADRNLFVATTAEVSTTYSHSKLMSVRPFTTLVTLVLRGGDAYNDNTIDISDASCIGAFYGTMTSACGGGSPVGSSPDVNEDGIVNILDLSLMGGNYGITSSTWAP